MRLPAPEKLTCWELPEVTSRPALTCDSHGFGGGGGGGGFGAPAGGGASNFSKRGSWPEALAGRRTSTASRDALQSQTQRGVDRKREWECTGSPWLRKAQRRRVLKVRMASTSIGWVRQDRRRPPGTGCCRKPEWRLHSVPMH